MLAGVVVQFSYWSVLALLSRLPIWPLIFLRLIWSATLLTNVMIEWSKRVFRLICVLIPRWVFVMNFLHCWIRFEIFGWTGSIYGYLIGTKSIWCISSFLNISFLRHFWKSSLSLVRCVGLKVEISSVNSFHTGWDPHISEVLVWLLLKLWRGIHFFIFFWLISSKSLMFDECSTFIIYVRNRAWLLYILIHIRTYIWSIYLSSWLGSRIVKTFIRNHSTSICSLDFLNSWIGALS